MRISNLLVLCYLLVFAFCLAPKQIENTSQYSIDFSKNIDLDNSGYLAIKFISEDNLENENFEFKLTEEFPNTEYETNWVSTSPLPLIIPLGQKPKIPTIHRPIFEHRFNNIEHNREILLKLDTGDYYLSLEGKNKILGRNFLFQFGFKSGRIQFLPNHNLIEEYGGHCVSETVSNIYMHYGSCSKVKIIPEKKTFINIYIPKSIPLTLSERLKIWGPFFILYINEYDVIYQSMKVKLINPE